MLAKTSNVTNLTAAERLIVALDFPTVDAARACVARLNDIDLVFKIGLELIYAGGLALAEELAGAGRKVFIDAKLLDIGNTVEKATANIAKLGVTYLTVHGIDTKTMAAAVAGRGDSAMKLLANAVMTNLTPDDLAEQGITRPLEELVVHRAKLAKAAGFDGVVPSAKEAAMIRAAVGDDLLIVTPGIRPAGTDTGDQARVMTPAKAIAAGATHLVVGRPITQADDPATAANAIVAEIAST
ncbi:MAG: orotidine-5'-phosphate decarboxylase [Hyphomicrobiaceae bacterium]